MNTINQKKLFFICTITFFTLAICSSILFRYIFLPYSSPASTDSLTANAVTFGDIYLKNIIVCTTAVSGLFFYRIPSLIVLIINPIFLGFVLGVNWAVTGELLFFLKYIIPHSFFEIPAILFACSIGVTGKKGRELYNIKKLTQYLLIIYVVLAIAAFVEVYITAKL